MILMMTLLEKLTLRKQSKVDRYKYEKEKPVYYWNWVRRLIGLNLLIIKIKYHG